jgi:HSP20 family protein
MAYWVQHQGRLWDPFREMREEMGRLFGSVAEPEGFYPRINVWANEEDVLLDVQVPGVNPEQIDLNVSRDEVSLGLERAGDEPEEEVTRHRIERGSGSFSRRLQLPFEVDLDQVKAEYAHGVLRVKLRRHEESKPRKVTVKIN